MANRPIPIGRMRHRVQVQARQGTNTRDAHGQITDATDPWVTLGTRWAEIQPTAGVEKFVATQSVQVSPETLHFVRIRCFNGLTPKHRLAYVDKKQDRTRIFEIEQVLNIDEINHQMHLRCRESL